MNTANRISRIIACFDEASKIEADYSNPESAKLAKERNDSLQREALQLASIVLSDTLGNIERIANALEKIAGSNEPASLLGSTKLEVGFKDS